ncbi:MAG: 4Fe-4S binding protein, partial [Oscillospiraceae bacterium]
MNSCLQLKKANCKNCYKCIRYCPIKAIKIEDNQAQIIKDECILCGRCFVHCPQNAKQIRNDVHKAKDLIASGHEVYVSIAPAFIANYNGISASSMEKALIELGFTGAEETAIGATI